MNKVKKFGIFIAALLLFTLFFGLGSHGLIDPDEGRYAEIPREMLETGDFITPRLNYVKYFEKPILHYWLTAASFAALGHNEFAARLTPALCSLGGAFLVFILARKRWGLDAGVYAVVVLSTGLLWFGVASINIIDMTVSFFITLSLTGYWLACGEGEGEGASGQSDRKYLLLFYAGMALATLSKGLIGIVLPGGIVFWHIALTRRWRLIGRMLYWPGIALFFFLSVPWFWAVCHANEDFFHFFFIQEHFLRYATRMHGRYQPMWFFVPILIAGLIPWAGLLPDIFLEAARQIGYKSTRSFGVFLGLWFAVPFIFFSLSSSKLIPYIVPCMPPLAILGGRILCCIAGGDGERGKRLLIMSFVIWLILTIGGFVYIAVMSDRAMAVNISRHIAKPLTAIFCFVCVGFFTYRARSYSNMVRGMCVLAFAGTAFFAKGFELAAETKSYRETAAVVRAHAGPGDVVVCHRDVAQGLSFYLGKRIVLANELGELEFGARHEKDPRWFIGSEALQSLWKEPTRVLLVTEARHVKRLVSLLGEGNIIEAGRTQSGVVLSNY